VAFKTGLELTGSCGLEAAMATIGDLILHIVMAFQALLSTERFCRPPVYGRRIRMRLFDPNIVVTFNAGEFTVRGGSQLLGIDQP